MLYEEFVNELTRRLQSEMNIPFDQIRFYEKGFKPESYEDQAITDMSNREYFDEPRKGLPLQDDIVTLKIPMNGALQASPFPLRSYYEYCCRHGWDEIMGQISSVARGKDTLDSLGGPAEIFVYEQAKKRFFPIPMSYEANEELETVAISRRYGGVLLVLYAAEKDISLLEGGNNQMIPLPRSYLDVWHKTQDEVIDDALQNCMEAYPPLLCDPTDEHEPELLTVSPSYHVRIGCTISTRKHILGATAMFYPGVAQTLFSLLGPFYYMPINLQNTVIFQDTPMIRGNLDTLKKVSKQSQGNQQASFPAMPERMQFYDGQDFLEIPES
ncbi:MAG: hypothetical protein IJ083_06980 [Clostridia bacterium]|nr:hypothetical protein [Clostridia bacterium]